MNDNTLEVKSLNTQFFTRVAEFESTTTSRRKRLVLSRLAKAKIRWHLAVDI